MDQESLLEIEFPPKGLDVMHALSEQPPGTTPRGVNVRLNEGLTTRSRGGSRTGISRYVPGLIPGGGLVQDLASVVTTDPDDPMTFDFTQYQWPDWTWPNIDFGWSWPGGWAWEGMWPGQGLGRGGYTPAVGGYQSSQGSVDAFANQRFILAGKAGSVGNGGATYNQTAPATIARTALGTATSSGSDTATILNVTVEANKMLVVMVAENGGAGIFAIGATHAGNALTLQTGNSSPGEGTVGIFTYTPLVDTTGSVVVTDGGSPANALAIAASKVSGLTVGVPFANSVGAPNGAPQLATTPATAPSVYIACAATDGPSADVAGAWQNSYANGQRDGTNTGGNDTTINEGYLIVTINGQYDALLNFATDRVWGLSYIYVS